MSDPVPETFHDSPKFWDPRRSRRLVTPGIFRITSMTVGEDHVLLKSDLDDSDYDSAEDFEDNVNCCEVTTNMKDHEFIRGRPRSGEI